MFFEYLIIIFLHKIIKLEIFIYIKFENLCIEAFKICMKINYIVENGYFFCCTISKNFVFIKIKIMH